MCEISASGLHFPRRRGRYRCAVWLLAMLLLGTGCSHAIKNADSSQSASNSDKPADTLGSARVERGPVRVDVRMIPGQPRLSDEPTLTVSITAEEGVRVQLPAFTQSIGDFLIRDFREPLPKTLKGKQVLQQVYTLEPTRAGKSRIDSFVVSFTDDRPNGDHQEHSLATEGLEIDVATMIAEQAPSLSELKAPAMPVELPRQTSPFWLWVGIGVVSCCVALAMLMRMRRHRDLDVKHELSPQQLATAELEELVRSQLAETDVKSFFVELTGVIRRYIERSTGVHAPEQTTEEFLKEINARQLFASEENPRLAEFLESADLVKFAGLKPDPQDIRDSLEKAKRFIELQQHVAMEAAA